MILIPIGRDDAEIRRHAWVSYVIIALNVLAFVGTETSMRTSRVTTIQRELNEAGEYLMAHPYLRVPPELARLIPPEVVQQLEKRRRVFREYQPAPHIVQREQSELEKQVREALDALETVPHRRFGYIPSEGGFVRLMTSMFIHAGFLHLLGNLLFFYLSGPFIEDVFGRPLFAILYMTGGIAASLTYGLKHPAGTIPLVGASGAIAAIMGAYLVRFLRSKVEFLFIPFIIRPMMNFRFFLPAFVVLPLWFIQQWLEMQNEATGGGVAFSAHVGGFVFGIVVALIVKMAGFEEKYVNPKVVAETTWTMDERTVRAMEAVREARALEDPVMLDTAATQLLGRYVEEKQLDLATELIHEITADRDARLPKFLPRAAVFAERSGDRDWALTLYERLLAGDPNSPAAVQSLVKIGTLLRVSGDIRGARESLAKARAHPACTAEWAPTIEAKIQQLDA